MSARRGIRTNVFSNVISYVASIVIALIVSPVIIHTLGDTRYGIWAIVAQLTGYYGLLDLGIRGAITHYTARYLARTERDALRSSIASGFWSLAALAGLALLVSGVIALLFPYMFKVGDAPIGEIRLAAIIMGAVLACSLPMNSLTAVLVGHERFDLFSGIEIVTRSLGAVAIYIVMRQGGNLVALALIQAGIALGRWVLTVYFVRRLFPELSLAPRHVERGALRDIVAYGSRSATIYVSQMVIMRTDLIVIGAFLSTSLVTVYAIGQMFVEYLRSAGNAIAYSLTPRLTGLFAEGSSDLERVYLLGGRLSSSLVCPLAAGLLAFGKPFIALWLGSEYVSGAIGERSDVILILLIAAELPKTLQSISWQLLFATRRHGFMARLSVIEALCNIALSVFLIHHLGLVGVALGTLVPVLVTQGVLMPQYVSTTCGISLRRFLVHGPGRPLLVGMVMFGLGVLMLQVAPAESWGVFVLDVAATTAIGVLLFALFVWRGEVRFLCARIQNGIARVAGMG